MSADPTEGTIEVESIPEKPSDLDICTWTNDPDEKRRAFVANLMANSDVEGVQLVKNMHAVAEWIRTGRPPDVTMKVVR